MINYKFDTLNDEEFEEIAKDLLREETGLDFRTFKKGRDGGIDLSYIGDEQEKTIGQVKHFAKSKFSNLKTTLSEEYDKIKNKKIERYLLVTSLDLTVKEVGEILKLMNGVIKSENDIYDLKKLNSILQNKSNEWIEKKYYKLWLSSTVVLGRIINNAQENNIEYYVTDINNKLRLYVVTQNLDNALNILDKNNMLLIHGEPGVGKTVLAEMLVYNFLAKGYKLKFISGNNIKELEQIMSPDENEKEVIFIDDFLGSNFLELFSSTSESKLVFFLKKYIGKKNKRVILTTRTTIYIKGIQQFEKFKHISIDFEEFNLKLSSYSDVDKAKILYNHIYFSEIEKDYIDEIKRNETYLRIIHHRNYTPRLIEFFTNKNRISLIKASEYRDFIFSSLDNPEEIWRNEFENRISDIDRLLVWTIFTFGEEISESILREAFEERYGYEIITNNYVREQNAFNKALEALSKGFININRRNDNEAAIAFINPSINDFLISYFNNDAAERKRIFSSVKYLEQLSKFALDNKYMYGVNFIIDNEDKKRIKQKIAEDFDCLKAYKAYKNKEVELLQLIKKWFVGEDSLKSVIKSIFNGVIKNNRMDDEKAELLLDMILNKNIDITEVEELFRENGREERLEFVILGSITYIETFIKYLTVIRLENDLALSFIQDKQVSYKIYKICRQAVADFVNDNTSIYDRCVDYDEEGNAYFDTDTAEEQIESDFERFKSILIFDYEDELAKYNLKETIINNLDRIFDSEYGAASGNKLLTTIEEIWDQDYKDNYALRSYDSDYDQRQRKISDMFEGL